ncbi:MAG TPA: DMT family transporter, partial [Euzebyales bacterium]|nr:DMT family transporter [Euzebyales bacterium]
ALWGTDALFRRGLALELHAATVVFAEHVLLVVLTAPLLWRDRRSLRGLSAGDWTAMALIGAGASATATVLFTAAFRFGDPTSVLLLQKLQPVIAVVAAMLLLGERLRPRFGLYAGGAVVGGWLIAFADPLAASLASARPALLAVGAATLWAFGTVLGRRLAVRLAAPTVTALRFAIGLPASAVLVAVFAGSAGFDVPAGAVGSLVGLALVPGLLSLWLYYRGLRTTPASVATLAELAFPLSAIVVNRIWFGATLTATQWVGVGVLMATLVVMSLQQSTRELGVSVPRLDVEPPGVSPSLPPYS